MLAMPEGSAMASIAQVYHHIKKTPGPGFPMALLKPVNIGIASLLGAQRPKAEEERYLKPLWQDVTRKAGVRTDRYVLRVTERRSLPFDRDVGPYIVTVDRAEIERLSPGEMPAVLAQRISRQTILLGSLLGACLWALLPTILVPLVVIPVLFALRVIYRSIFTSADQAAPHALASALARTSSAQIDVQVGAVS
jgi:hypothetical protein